MMQAPGSGVYKSLEDLLGRLAPHASGLRML